MAGQFLAGVVTLAGAAIVAMPSVAPAVSGGGAARDLRRHRRLVRRRQEAQAAQAAPTTPSPTPTGAATPATSPTSPPATTAPPDQDLCGSSYANVPELWFTPACANHDRCYGAHQGKAACDTAFLKDMLAICANLPSSGGVNSNFTRASCRAAARLYYKGVVIGGGFSYCHRPVCRDGE